MRQNLPGGHHGCSGKAPPARESGNRRSGSMSDENKAVVRRFIEEVYNRGNLSVADELLAPDFIDHDVFPGEDASIEGYKRAVAKQLAASSNLHFSIEEQIAEGDKVVTRLIGRGTHDQKAYEGLAPSGARITIENITINRVVEGKIVEEWNVAENTDLWQQRLEQERIERERFEQELRVARRIQQASLPKEVPTLESWQIAPYFQPAREVGGDFYEFFELEDGRVALVVGDATGKGVPAALVVAATCSMLRAVAQDPDYSPGEVLAQVNEVLLTRIPPNMFVTCFYAILEPESGRLLYANAGHNLPCCNRHDEHAARELSARGMPLGLMPQMSYEENETALVDGESVLF